VLRRGLARSSSGADRIPGIGVAVGRLDGDVWTAGHDLLFPACSISKHVAAFGTLWLVADATIDLDTDVNAYLVKPRG
jgi:CubicO group peptidase (beta-lactamase class C family)